MDGNAGFQWSQAHGLGNTVNGFSEERKRYCCRKRRRRRRKVGEAVDDEDSVGGDVALRRERMVRQEPTKRRASLFSAAQISGETYRQRDSQTNISLTRSVSTTTILSIKLLLLQLPPSSCRRNQEHEIATRILDRIILSRVQRLHSTKARILELPRALLAHCRAQRLLERTDWQIPILCHCLRFVLRGTFPERFDSPGQKAIPVPVTSWAKNYVSYCGSNLRYPSRVPRHPSALTILQRSSFFRSWN